MKPTKPPVRNADLPTVAAVTTYISSFFPEHVNDVQFMYHRPYTRGFDPAAQKTPRMVLSVTPTRGFYEALRQNAFLGFLHRPFGLERKQVLRKTTILSSHKSFDEFLTVGWNLPLAERLGLEIATARVVQGYKGDAERKIGIVAKFAGSSERLAEDLRANVLREYGGTVEGDFGFDTSNGDNSISSPSHVSGIAIMNAFHPAEVERVCGLARELGLEPREMLYLTGAVREAGLEAARNEGMRVVCVGHRACEEWGIRYLGSKLREKFAGLQVEEVFEEEEPSVGNRDSGSGMSRQNNSNVANHC